MIRIISTSIGLGLASLVMGQAPANDSCHQAIPVTCGTSVSGTTINSTLDSADAPVCGPASITAGGVWYSFVGTGDFVTLSTCDSATFDTKISVFTGPCGGLSCVAGNDDGQDCTLLTSIVGFNSSLGVPYYILVHGFATETGDFTLSVTCSAPCTVFPANDICQNAAALTVYSDTLSCVSDTGTNVCAVLGMNTPCDPYGNVQDVWYTFNSGSYQAVYITLSEITGSGYEFALYDTSCSSEPFFCAQPVPGEHVLIGLSAATTYWLQVWNGGFSHAGECSICVSGYVPPPPPDNDPCVDADALTVNTTCVFTAGTCVSATQDLAPITCNSFTSASAYDVWYSFVATSSNVDIIVDPGFDPVVELLDGCTGATLGCSDSVGIAPELIVATGLAVGNTYYVRVYPWQAFPDPLFSDGDFEICVVHGAVSVETPRQTSAVVFPNPNAGIFSVRGITPGNRLVITDVVGREAHSRMATSETEIIAMESGHKGIYFLTVAGDAGLQAIRLVLE